MPAIFFGHGSPMNALDDNRYTQTWSRLGRSLPVPRAILAVSAHWFVRGTHVTATTKPRTIHDFGRFPQALFDFQYPAAGDPSLARRVRDLLAPVEVGLDNDWGLDHGTWSVLAHAYPQAEIPVVQLSIDETLSAAEHYALAQRLAPLRDEGIMIVGSGSVVHNLGPKPPAATSVYPAAEAFHARTVQAIETRDHNTLIAYDAAGEAARFAVPTPEHYLPLLYVLALQDADEAAHITVDGFEMGGAISMLSAVVG